MTDTRPATRYRFGVFEVDSTTGELRRKGVRVKLHSQPFQVLFMLLERPGEMLTREEICRELWPDGTFVDYEHGVNSAVNRLRDALGDKASNPRFIETLPRRGYRFLAPVERITLEEEKEEASTVAVAAQVLERATSASGGAGEDWVSRSGASHTRGPAKELAFHSPDTLCSATGDVPWLLCGGTLQPGGDQ
jgi:cholera toxin transcriptional activator